MSNSRRKPCPLPIPCSTKKCEVCGSRARALKYRETHKDKVLAASRAAYSRDPGKANRATQASRVKDRTKHRANSLKFSRKKDRGFSEELFQTTYALQQGKCFTCDRPIRRYKAEPEAIGQIAHCDHDHKTNSPRSLLCPYCNLAIGVLERSPEYIDRLMAYLEFWKVRENG